jgi:hypothetical protein
VYRQEKAAFIVIIIIIIALFCPHIVRFDLPLMTLRHVQVMRRMTGDVRAAYLSHIQEVPASRPVPEAPYLTEDSRK